MNFEQLKIFIAVVDHRSFTKAAESLYISHSTTSRNVASLEEDMGVQLLQRDNRSVRLTPAGEILYTEGVKLLKKVETIENSVKNAGMGLFGKLTVATADFGYRQLWSGYDDFCKKYPEVMLGVYTRNITEICTQVIGGDIDVGVTYSYALPEDMSEFECRCLSHESFCVAAAPHHPLGQKKTVTMDDLMGTSYIEFPSGNFDFLKNPEEQAKISLTLRDKITVPTIESLFLQVRSGNGVSLVPRPMVKGMGDSYVFLDLDGLDTSFDIVVIWRKDNHNPTLPLFVDTVIGGDEK